MIGILKVSELKVMFYGVEFKEILDEVFFELFMLCIIMEIGIVYEIFVEFEVLFVGFDYLFEIEMVFFDDIVFLMFMFGIMGNLKRCMIIYGGIYRYVIRFNSLIICMKSFCFFVCYLIYYMSVFICIMFGMFVGIIFVFIKD